MRFAVIDADASFRSAPLCRVSQQIRELEVSDPLLISNLRRWVMFPIRYPSAAAGGESAVLCLLCGFSLV